MDIKFKPHGLVRAAFGFVLGTIGWIALAFAVVGRIRFGAGHVPPEIFLSIVSGTTYLADAKIVYGAIQNQVSTLAAVMNLFGDGSKFGKQINDVGLRGWQFLARLQPNWNLGFRPEGTAGVGLAGNQGLNNSTVVLKYAYVPILITGQAENLTKGESRAFMQAKALEAKYDMEDMVSHANVLMVGAEPGGELALVSASAAGSLTCSTAGNLPGAIYLRVGMPIDAAPVGGGALSLNGAIITAINYATGVVTHNGGTATVGHAVALSGEYPTAAVTGDAWITINGFQQIVSNAAGVFQGLDNSVSGNQAWTSYKTDAGNVQITPSTLQQLRQFVKMRGGLDTDMFFMGPAQINQYVNVATTNLRFEATNAHTMGQKKALDLGFLTFDFAGLAMLEDKDFRPDRIIAGATETMKKFEAIALSLAEDEASTWTRVYGNGPADAVFALLRWYFQIGTLQRSAWGMLFDLQVPTAFQNAPPTL
jgi:hypothetical protein